MIIWLLMLIAHTTPRPIYTGPILCGPMFDAIGDFDKQTSECVARVIFTGRRAVVIVPCRDGARALAQVWLDASGELDMQGWNEVCGEHNAVPDGGTE